ncbi:MAG: hypothetical protein ACR2QG_09645, partial [Gammaproteobacteria bacterium]
MRVSGSMFQKAGVAVCIGFMGMILSALHCAQRDHLAGWQKNGRQDFWSNLCPVMQCFHRALLSTDNSNNYQYLKGYI